MSKTRLVTTIFTCISAITLAGLAIRFLAAQPLGGETFGFLGWAFGQNLARDFLPFCSQTIVISGITGIFVDWTVGEVRFTPYDGDEISVTEFAKRDLNENERMNITVSDGKLNISFTRRTVMRMPPKQLEVLIPADLSQKLHAVEAETVSGGIIISDISAFNMRVRTVSGALDFSNAAAQSLLANSTSGGITLKNVTSDNMSIGSKSGTLNLVNVKAGQLNSNTVSGAQDFNGEFVRVDAAGISAEISVQSTIVPELLNISTVSGRVDVTVPDNGNNISVSHSSVSGIFSSELPTLAHGADARFRISTTSGNINIYELRQQ